MAITHRYGCTRIDNYNTLSSEVNGVAILLDKSFINNTFGTVQTLSAQEANLDCSRRFNETSGQVFTSKTHEVRSMQVNDGGGGGGGATYVFLVSVDLYWVYKGLDYPFSVNDT